MMFGDLTSEQVTKVIDAMFAVECQPAQVVIAQGDLGDNFYVVESGEYSVLLKQRGYTPVHYYHRGDAFGELALLYNTPRAATVQCVEGGTLWALDRVAFRKILMAHNQSATASTAMFLKSVTLLSGLTDQQRTAVGSVLIEENYTHGQVIVKQNTVADSLYVIKHGTCVAHVLNDRDRNRNNNGEGDDLGREVARMGPGGVFGESSLQDNMLAQKRQASVVASGEVTMLRLNRVDFVELLGELNDIIKQNFNEKVMGSMEMFKALTHTQKAVLVDSLVEERYYKDEDIIQQGDIGDSFYIIVSGSVRVTREEPEDGTIIMIKERLLPGAYFGEMALLQDDGVRMATVTSNEDTVVMSLTRETFTEFLGPMNDILTRETERRQRDIERSRRPPIKLKELDHVKTLGVGAFGRVKLVKHKGTGLPYALKCMRKGQIVQMKQVAHVCNEKDLLDMCDHPFILGLVGHMQDDREIYMLFELVLGGELFSELDKRKSFDFPSTRFYSACVASALSYLHERQICYRDLKPENLLFDADGYIKLVDFGFAKIVEDRTWTLCGTPDYMSPEVISYKGHNGSVDWWAFGILVYEMLVGKAPFSAHEPMETFRNVLNMELLFPFLFPAEAKLLIEATLDRNPIQRLGSLGLGALDVIEHEFFGELSFAELERRTMPAPFIPNVMSPYDGNNYDDYPVEDGTRQPDEEEQEQLAYYETFNKDKSLFNTF